MSKFTKEKQLAFGSIIGGFLSAVQRENELSDNDMVALVLNVAAGQASIARWSLESFVAQAQRAYQQSAAVIRPDAPPPLELDDSGDPNHPVGCGCWRCKPLLRTAAERRLQTSPPMPNDPRTRLIDPLNDRCAACRMPLRECVCDWTQSR